MFLLKEPITSLMFVSSYANTFDALLENLTKMGIEIEMQNRRRGEIVTPCLPRSYNMIFWKCWIDRLLFEVKLADNARTQVDIFGLPNLLRVRQDKTLININEILSQIRHDTDGVAEL